ncbi:MAG: hypothetical protein ACRERE_01705 [Candidatus Entotheonellia bacterium]
MDTGSLAGSTIIRQAMYRVVEGEGPSRWRGRVGIGVKRRF